MEMDIRPVRERILSVVCPLADKNYQQQLEIKKTAIEDILRQFREKFMRTNRFFKNHNIGKFYFFTKNSTNFQLHEKNDKLLMLFFS